MAAAKKLDLYKTHRSEYVTPKKPVLVTVKPAKYLTLTGQGAPASVEFQNKISALYGVAYTIKMTKKLAGQDYKACRLEGLWWGSGEGTDFASDPPDTWNWTLLIRVPDFIQQKDVQQAVAKLREKGKAAGVAEVKLETLDEGESVQMLHVGPYDRESKTIAQMREFAREKGLACRGKHHEIYLSDPRRVPAARLGKILRHPLRPIK
jgi:hypothetical protein